MVPMRKVRREIKDPNELREIIDLCDSVNIAVNAGVYPYVFAVNYGYEYTEQNELVLYFHSAKKGRKIDLLQADPHVAFEMDCDHTFRHNDRGMHCTMDYRSIMGIGIAEFVTDRAEMQHAIDLLLEHCHSNPGFVVDDNAAAATWLIKIKVREMTGKKKTPDN